MYNLKWEKHNFHYEIKKDGIILIHLYAWLDHETPVWRRVVVRHLRARPSPSAGNEYFGQSWTEARRGRFQTVVNGSIHVVLSHLPCCCCCKHASRRLSKSFIYQSPSTIIHLLKGLISADYTQDIRSVYIQEWVTDFWCYKHCIYLGLFALPISTAPSSCHGCQ